MKFYKIENGKFSGFYDSEIHGIEEENDEFKIISDEKWQELLNGHSQGKEIRILDNGVLGLYERAPLPTNVYYAKPDYDYNTHSYVDVATDEEKLEYYKKELIQANIQLNQSLISGFDDAKLRDKISILTRLHQEASQEIANKINETL